MLLDDEGLIGCDEKLHTWKSKKSSWKMKIPQLEKFFFLTGELNFFNWKIFAPSTGICEASCWKLHTWGVEEGK